ncbi:MAG: hypothetical protein P9D89_06015 [Candidatus Contendobacter sp.]|nr:hypothetical protein [Candidatus Contendobacter sp.]
MLTDAGLQLEMTLEEARETDRLIKRHIIWDEATRKAEEEGAKLTAKRVEEATLKGKPRPPNSGP